MFGRCSASLRADGHAKDAKALPRLTRDVVSSEPHGDFTFVELLDRIEVKVGRRLDAYSVHVALEALVKPGYVIKRSELRRVQAYDHPFRGHVPEKTVVASIYRCV
jgi:hypothetical protein